MRRADGDITCRSVKCEALQIPWTSGQTSVTGRPFEAMSVTGMLASLESTAVRLQFHHLTFDNGEIYFAQALEGQPVNGTAMRS
jgi:hypothetical protein